MTSARVVRTGLIVGVIVLFSLPLVFLFQGSIRPPGLPPPDGFEFIPPYVRWENYPNLSLLIPLGTYLRNSTIVVAIAVPLTVLVASWAGFTIVTGSRLLRRITITITVIGLMVPLTALWVPRFVMFHKLGLTDTLWPLIVPALMGTSPFFVLVFVLVYSRIPRQLFEAADLEGITPLTQWRTIAWPLGRAAVFAVGVLAFAAHWSSFMEPLIYLADGDRFTLPVGLHALFVMEPTMHPLLLAAALIACLPVIIVFAVAQRAIFSHVTEVE